MPSANAEDQQREERFVRLETKIAYQEKLLFELSEVLTGQARQLELLTARLTRLEAVLQAPEDQASSLPHERPPHY